MKIVIPGGSGQVGTLLARAFHGRGDDVVLSRRAGARPWRVVTWDGATLGSWQRVIDGCDVVINLTGRSVNCRYTAARREEILTSRRVVPARLLEHGFTFRFPHWSAAARDLCDRWRVMASGSAAA
jgi:NAD dependent epimerase/dehydratase family enzyme